MLLFLIILPFFSLLFLSIIPRKFLNFIKIFSLCSSLFIFFFSLILYFIYDPFYRYNYKFLLTITNKDFIFKDLFLEIDLQFRNFFYFFDGINYIIGIDGISLLFIILTTLLFPLCFLLN
jgi:NADH:ubiquinone oxidoreductase subunit 4 (subunit M)